MICVSDVFFLNGNQISIPVELSELQMLTRDPSNSTFVEYHYIMGDDPYISVNSFCNKNNANLDERSFLYMKLKMMFQYGNMEVEVFGTMKKIFGKEIITQI